MPEPSQELSSTQVVRAAWVFYLVLALGGVAWIGWREGMIPLALFVDPGSWWIDVGAGLAAGGLLIAAWRYGVRRLPAARHLEDHLSELLGPLSTDEVIAMAVLSGIAEELFFRGAVQGSWGWLWATLLFALLHTGPGRAFLLWSVFAAVAGALFGGLVVWRGTLLPAILAHFLVNAVNLHELVGRRAGEDGEEATDVEREGEP